MEEMFLNICNQLDLTNNEITILYKFIKSMLSSQQIEFQYCKEKSKNIVRLVNQTKRNSWKKQSTSVISTQ